MKISDYNYELPKERIAQHPPKKRGDAKLLVLDKNTGKIEDKKYADVLEYLNPGDVVVLNNTKVIKARLEALGGDGKKYEILLTEKHGQAEDKYHHKAMYRGKLVEGMDLAIDKYNVRVIGVYDDGTALLESTTDFMEIAKSLGHVPLPPYMKREDTKEDVERYQTEFAKSEGSVAAPTASLNFTDKLIDKLKAKGIEVCYLTLHVGLGTFMPIRTDDIKKHKMHSEWFSIPNSTVETINNVKKSGNKVLAVGTTVARTLEYASVQINSNQENIEGEADIFIYPGYEFKIVDMLLTNFHTPKSTVLMLAGAFAGWENLQKAYEHAIHQKYNFLSYGDSMLIL
jgi:S-adenosylmethionine:tRNA ribosyltransferase-isomerase